MTASQASASYRAKLKASGYKQKAFMLSPAAQEALAKLAAVHGSETKALEALLTGPPIIAAARRSERVAVPGPPARSDPPPPIAKPSQAAAPVRTLSPGRACPKPGKKQ